MGFFDDLVPSGGVMLADDRSDLNGMLNDSPETSFLGKPRPTPSPSPTPQPSRVAQMIDATPQRALIAGDVTGASVQNAQGGAFDDLVPQQTQGKFDDLIPQQRPASNEMSAEEMSRTGQTHYEPSAVTAGTKQDPIMSQPLVSPQIVRAALEAGAATNPATQIPYLMARAFAPQQTEGVTQGASEAGASFTSPNNVAMLAAGALVPEGAVGKVANTALAAYFEAQAIHQMPEQWKQYQESTDPSERAKLLTEMSVGMGLPASMMFHVIKGEPKAAEAAPADEGAPEAAAEPTAQNPVRSAQPEPLLAPLLSENARVQPKRFSTDELDAANAELAPQGDAPAPIIAPKDVDSHTAFKSLAPKMAKEVQVVYDEWTQDADGIDEELGSGGICQDIAQKISGVLGDNGIESTTVDNGGVGEQHVWVIAKMKDGVYNIDIPPHVYETGGGYNWTKRQGVKFDQSHITIDKLDSDPKNFKDYAGEGYYDEGESETPEEPTNNSEAPRVREALSLDEIRLMREKNDLQLQNDLAQRVGGRTHPAIDERIGQINNELDSIANAAVDRPRAEVPEGAFDAVRQGESNRQQLAAEDANIQPQQESRPLDNATEAAAMEQPAGQRAPTAEQPAGVGVDDASAQRGAAGSAAQPFQSEIANRYSQARTARGELGAVQTGRHLSPQELLTQGLKASPERVSQAASRVMQGGDIQVHDQNAIRAEEARLSQRAAQASLAAKANPTSTALRIAEDEANKYVTDWHNGPIAKIKENWHLQGEGLQASIPVDLSTFNGQRENFLRSTGKAATKAQEPALRASADRVTKTRAAEADSLQRLGAEVEKATRGKKIPSADEVAAHVHETMKIEPCRV